MPDRRKTERTAERERQHIGYHIEQTKAELRQAGYAVLRLAPGSCWHLLGCGPSDIRLLYVACGCRKTPSASKLKLPFVPLPVYINLVVRRPVFVKEVWIWKTTGKRSTFTVERLRGVPHGTL